MKQVNAMQYDHHFIAHMITWAEWMYKDDLPYRKLEEMPIWQVVTFDENGSEVVLVDYLTSAKADRMALRAAMADSKGIYEACGMPLHNQHIWQWEILQASKRIIKTLEGMK